MASIGDLTAKLTLDTTQFTSGIDSASKKTSGFSKALAGIGKTTAVAVAGASVAVGKLVSDSVKSYADYEQLIGGVDTLFKESSQLVQNFASSAYERAGINQNQYMEQVTSFSASLLQALDGDTEKAARSADQAIVDMADNANKMGTPLESIQNAYQGFAKQNYTMLDNLKLGYGGTKKEMERLLADAQKISGVKYDISNLNDVYSAIHVIQTELGITGTTAEEASNTLSGSMSMFKASWSNLMTAIVQGGEPLRESINDFVYSAKTMAKNFAPAIKNALLGVSALITELAPIILAEIPNLVGQLLPEFVNAVKSILDGVMNALPALLQTLKDSAPMVTSAISDLIPTVITFLLDSIPQLIDTGMTLLGALAQGLLQSIDKVIPQITEFVQKLTDTVKSEAESGEGMASAGLSMMTNLVKGLADSVVTLLPDLTKAVADLIAEFATLAGKNTTETANVAINLLKQIIDSLAPSIPSLMADITNAVMAIIKAIVDVITGLDTESFLSACVTIVTALADGITESIYVITDKLPELITGIVAWLTNPENLATLADSAITIFGVIVSDSAKILEALATGLYEIVKGIADYFIEHKEEIQDGFKDAFVGIGDKIKTTWEEQIKPAFVGEGGLVGKIKSWIDEAGETLKNIGANLVGKIKSGILTAIENAKDTIRNAFLALIPDFAKDWFGLNGGSSSGGGSSVGNPTDVYRAGGGSVNRNQPYVVGEEGMELFVPNSNGFIVPNDELQQLFGGVTVNVGNVYGESYLRDYVEERVRGVVREEVRLGA